MTNLRLIGVAVGLLGLLLSFLYFRGHRWHKFNFVMSIVLSVSVAAVSIEPNSMNILRRVLSFEQGERGRLIGLLVTSTIFLYFLVLYTKSRADELRYKFDLMARSIAVEQLERLEIPWETVPRILVIIPAYNEAENLKVLLPSMPKKIDGLDAGVLVIDDGSSDDTSAVAREHGCLVIRNFINRGQGAASRAGYDASKRIGASIGVTMDADNQHRPEDLPTMVKPILDNRLDLVIGSRRLGQHEGGSWIRQLGVVMLSQLLSLVVDTKLTDCSSGFKAFSIERMGRLRLIEDQFQSAEVLISAAKQNLRIGEVPIFIRQRAHGDSKKGADWKYGLRFALVIARSWWR